MKGKVFTAQKVQSMIAGNMTMFREVIKQPFLLKCYKNRYYEDGIPEESKSCDNTLSMRNAGMKCCDCNNEIISKCLYQVGQEIFVKEGFFVNNFKDLMFKATFEYCSKRFSRLKDLYHDKNAKWKPAQHMKQEHSRLTLLIKEIRVERLAGISEEDMIKEGHKQSGYNESLINDLTLSRKDFFKRSWNATHKKPGEKFEASPFVFVYQFELIK
jgi:hypothetical protein